MVRLVSGLSSVFQRPPIAQASASAQSNTATPAASTTPLEFTDPLRSSGVQPSVAHGARGRFNLQASLMRGLNRRDRDSPFSAEELAEVYSLPVMQRLQILRHAHERSRYADLAEMRLLLPRSSVEQLFYWENNASLSHAGFSREQTLALARLGVPECDYMLSHARFFSSRGFSADHILSIARSSAVRQRLLFEYANQLLAAGWRPVELALNMDGTFYDRNGLPNIQPPTDDRFLVPSESDRLRVIDSRPAAIAAARWGWTGSTAEAQAFTDKVIPPALLAQLQDATDPDSKDLLVLVAGLVHTADFQSAALRRGFINRARQILAYIEAADDPQLLRDCAREAADAVNNCGDRISYGLTRLAQTVECHKMVQGDVSPGEVFESVRRHFNQLLVEQQAVIIAGSRDDARESVETYLSLAMSLAGKGVRLEEVAQASLYNSVYAVGKADVKRVHALIDRHQKGPSEELKTAFVGHPAVEKALSKCFETEYQALIKKRDELAENAGERLFEENASPAVKRKAERDLEEAGEIEARWFADKVALCLKKPGLLG